MSTNYCINKDKPLGLNWANRFIKKFNHEIEWSIDYDYMTGSLYFEINEMQMIISNAEDFDDSENSKSKVLISVSKRDKPIVSNLMIKCDLESINAVFEIVNGLLKANWEF